MMNANRIPIRILGLDPGLRRTGWGVVVAEGSRLRWIAHGVVTPDERAPFSERLLHLLAWHSAEHLPERIDLLAHHTTGIDIDYGGRHRSDHGRERGLHADHTVGHLRRLCQGIVEAAGILLSLLAMARRTGSQHDYGSEGKRFVQFHFRLLAVIRMSCRMS